jgi:hypothetical protein
MRNAGTTLIVIAGFLWGAPWRQREALRVLRAIQRTALVMGLGIITLLTVFPNEVGSRLAIYSETLLLDSPTSEITIMRFRPANIRVINRRENSLDRDLRLLREKRRKKKTIART